MSTLVTCEIIYHDPLERLPDDEMTVLVMTADYESDIGYVEGGQWFWAASGCPIEEAVILWAELPDYSELVMEATVEISRTRTSRSKNDDNEDSSLSLPPSSLNDETEVPA